MAGIIYSPILIGHPTYALDAIIADIRRAVPGFLRFTIYQLRGLLAAGGHRPFRDYWSNTPGKSREEPIGRLTSSNPVRWSM